MTMRATFLLSAACWSGEAWKCLRPRRAGAIALLESTADVAIVLMDIMMPEMDGYQTTQAIRSNGRIPPPAHHHTYGEGHEGRSGEVP